MKYKEKEIVYMAIKLSEDSKARLLKISEEILPKKVTGIESNWVRYCDHLTLGFGGRVSDALLKCLGMDVKSLPIEKILIDDFSVGCFFETRQLIQMRGIEYANDAKPHVTMAMQKGIPPVCMGTITERNHSVIVPEPLIIEGRIGAFVDSGEWIFA